MKILIIADPLESFKTYKDTTFAMIREFAKRDITLFHCLSSELSIKNNQVIANTTQFEFIDNDANHWFRLCEVTTFPLYDFDAVIMRTDPPFDLQYLYSTQLLSLAEQQGAKVFNSGQAMRDYNEKLAILNFSKFVVTTIVTNQASDVEHFLEEHQDIIVKPLDGMGGMEIYRLTKDGYNNQSILESLMKYNTRTIMAQRYIPEVVKGDKRILIIDGKPIDYALARIPKSGETRANLAAGGKGVAMPLTPRELDIANTLAPQLKKDGILLAGLDVIGDYLTEVNVTSPTGFQEIMQQKDYDVAKLFVDAIFSNL
ncbi:MAG: glutathione synthase [Neisseriaceae bacterium]|nr:glutathione synthase [Neisseriaceae bacterium PsAf]MCV2509056.1 glutathione synthase [Neisseriaceae bacterium]